MTQSDRENLDEQLSAYIDKELSGEERARVEQRLATDAAARRLVDEMERLRQDLHALPQHRLDGDFSARLLAKLAEHDPPEDGGASNSPDTSPGPAAKQSSTASPFYRDADDRFRGFRRGLAWAAAIVAASVLLMLFQGPQVHDAATGPNVARRTESRSAEPDAPDVETPDLDAASPASSSRELPELRAGDSELERAERAADVASASRENTRLDDPVSDTFLPERRAGREDPPPPSYPGPASAVVADDSSSDGGRPPMDTYADGRGWTEGTEALVDAPRYAEAMKTADDRVTEPGTAAGGLSRNNVVRESDDDVSDRRARVGVTSAPRGLNLAVEPTITQQALEEPGSVTTGSAADGGRFSQPAIVRVTLPADRWTRLIQSLHDRNELRSLAGDQATKLAPQGLRGQTQYFAQTADVLRAAEEFSLGPAKVGPAQSQAAPDLRNQVESTTASPTNDGIIAQQVAPASALPRWQFRGADAWITVTTERARLIDELKSLGAERIETVTKQNHPDVSPTVILMDVEPLPAEVAE